MTGPRVLNLMDLSTCICKIAQVPSTSTASQPLSLSICLTINRDMTWKLFVHGRKVEDGTSAVLEMVPETLQLVSANAFLARLDSLNVCIGNPDCHFVMLTRVAYYPLMVQLLLSRITIVR